MSLELVSNNYRFQYSCYHLIPISAGISKQKGMFQKHVSEKRSVSGIWPEWVHSHRATSKIVK